MRERATGGGGRGRARPELDQGDGMLPECLADRLFLGECQPVDVSARFDRGFDRPGSRDIVRATVRAQSVDEPPRVAIGNADPLNPRHTPDSRQSSRSRNPCPSEGQSIRRTRDVPIGC